MAALSAASALLAPAPRSPAAGVRGALAACCVPPAARSAAAPRARSAAGAVISARAAAARVSAAAGPGGGGLSEEALNDMLAKLAAAEAEASKLRDELASKEVAALAGKSQEELSRLKPGKLASGLRVNSTEARLGGVRSKDAAGVTSWLSESDLDFFAGNGPGEVSAGSNGVAPEDEATLQRRLLLGGLGTALFAALSLVPSSSGPPAKPLFFYLVPLLRVQTLLTDAEAVVADADWSGLSSLRAAMLGYPNDARESLRCATAALGDARLQERAKALAASVLEYIDQADPAAYFDSRAAPTGAQNAEFAAFSLRAVKAAGVALTAFLALMPAEDLEAARGNVAAF